MRVLVTSGIFPPEVGGPATYVPRICTELRQRGHEVSVVCLSDSTPAPDGCPFPVQRVGRGHALPRRLAMTIGLIVRRGRGADVIFANGLHLETVAANFALRKPLVFKVVGDWAWERAANRRAQRIEFESFDQCATGWPVRFDRALRSFAVRRAGGVIVPSKFLARAAVRWGAAAGRVTVIPNAVELPPSLPPVALPLTTRFTAVAAGRLVPWKNLDRTLYAVAGVPGAGLAVVGDGPERESLEALALSLGIRDRVWFAGNRSREETLSLMSRCDALVLNSTYEGLPHVVLEAMALGLPVVATAAGGTPEIVRDGENGLLVPPLDDEALRAALSRLAASRGERQRMASQALLTLARFSPKTMIDETERALARTAERGVLSPLPAQPR